MESWVIDRRSAGRRFDLFLSATMEISRGAAQRQIESGRARVNGESSRPSYRVREGDRVEADEPEMAPSALIPEPIPLDVVYEDKDLLVINKPRGMVVHPAPGAERSTLAHAVLAHAQDLSGIGGVMRPGIVHRLDKDTSGLLVVAKNDAAHHSLQAQIQAKAAERRYEAIVWGSPPFEQAEIDAPIGRHPRDRKKMAVITDPRQTSRPAVTELRVLERLGPFSYVEARLRTGRTHQIRVHCAYAGHPVVGDALYRGARRVPSESISPSDRAQVQEAVDALAGQALHARTLAFDHPRTGKRLSFEAPLPEVLDRLLALLRAVYADAGRSAATA